MDASRLLDTESLRTMLGPHGQWARDAGERVRDRRHSLGWSLAVLATLADTDPQTISRVETAVLVPREYLKVAIANALACEVTDLWRPVKRSDLVDHAA